MSHPPVLQALVEQLPSDLRDALATQYLPRLPVDSGLDARDISLFHWFDVAELIRDIAAAAGRRGRRSPTLSVMASVHSPDAAAMMPSCGNTACPRRSHVDFASLLVCARCRTVKYCDADCQRADWKVHKRVCKAAAAAADAREAGGAAAAAKAAEVSRNSFRASRLVGTLCSEISVLYSAWAGRFGGMPGVVLVESPDFLAWSGGPEEDAAAVAAGVVDFFGNVPVGAESGCAFISFLPLRQLAAYAKDAFRVPHKKAYPPCKGPAATGVAPRLLHETLLGPEHETSSLFFAMLSRCGIISATGGPGSTAVSEEIFIVVRETCSGFVKLVTMRNPYRADDLSAAVEARWESAVNEQLGHADVLVAKGDGRRFALNWHCVETHVAL